MTGRGPELTIRGMPKTLYLIDGHAQIYRAYYARMGPLTSPTGEPTRATHVFCAMLLSMIRQREPDYLAVALDISDETVFRREIYPEYKATREAPPEDFPVQKDRILSILEAAGIPILVKPGFEADDIMATLAERYAPDMQVYLVSKDKDLEQLLTGQIHLYDPGKDEVIDPERLLESKGWRPEQALDVQTLCGDTVDNIPGVKGIGPKTAAKLIARYGTARAVIEHADELTPKQSENVKAFAPLYETTRRLLQLRSDVPIDLDLEAADVGRFAWASLQPIFAELGFRRLVEQLPGVDRRASAAAVAEAAAAAVADSATVEAPRALTGLKPDARAAALAEPVRPPYRRVDDVALLEDLGREIQSGSYLVIEAICSAAAPPPDLQVTGLALAWGTGQAAYLPLRCMTCEPLPRDAVAGLLAEVCTDGRILGGYDLKQTLLALRTLEIRPAGRRVDAMIAAFVLDPVGNSVALDRLVSRVFGHELIPRDELTGKGRDRLLPEQLLLDPLTEYAGERADYIGRLVALCGQYLEDSPVTRLFHELEMPLLDVLTEMESAGINLDVPLLEKMSADLGGQLEELQRAAHEAAGREFNLDSPKQLAEILFDEMGLRVVKRTRTSRSTDAETLQALAGETDSRLPQLLLDYRELQKLRSTYVDALPAARAKGTGRVHTRYHQTGAITGRLSSSDPNLQNIPIRTELGRQIRAAFVPRVDDAELVVADYSQIELRMLAHFSEDAALIEAFAEDRDIHAVVAARVNGVSLEEVTREMRGRAKAVNFGIIYGQTAFGLAQGTGMSRGEAQRFIDNYFDGYPRVRGFIEQCIRHAKQHGFVETLFGRRREIRDIDSRNRMARAQAERFAVNTVIQGSAADLIKLAMNRLHDRIVRERLPLTMLLQVHDELVCESPRGDGPRMGEVVRDVMSTAMDLRVPLKVDLARGSNWLEAK